MFKKEIVDKIDGLQKMDVLNLDVSVIDSQLDFLVPLYQETKQILSRFSIVCEESTLTCIDDLVDKMNTILEWQGLLEHYDDNVVFIHGFLTNLKSVLSNEIDNLILEAQFADTEKTVNMKLTERKKYGQFITKSLREKKLVIDQQLLVWDSLKGQVRKKASDLKANVQTLKTLIHSYEIRPEIFVERAKKAILSEEERLKKLDSLKNGYLNNSSASMVDEGTVEKSPVDPVKDLLDEFLDE